MRRFLSNHPGVLGYIIGIGGLLFGGYLLAQHINENTDAIAQIQQERSDRISQADSTNGFFCGQNNIQDNVLGNLVAVSLNGGSFGGGIDISRLSPFQQSVLAAIAKVQHLSQATPKGRHFTVVFTDSLRDLRDRTNCAALVENGPGSQKGDR